MELSLVHTGLAAGAALAALPVILHLFMRQTPKHVIFPALRLIRERQKRSKKRLRVKNWLLLLARMALLALMALALARPTMMSQATAGEDNVPSAIALVFDTSLSMEYKERDKTRLDEAKALALEIVEKTHGTSQVFVIDSAEQRADAMSPALARKRIESLTTRAVNRPLNASVALAYTAVADVDRQRREVFVLTDLSRSAWDMDNSVDGLAKSKDKKAPVKTYVLRLAPKEPYDVAIVEAKPAADVVTEGEGVEIRARLRSIGKAASGVAKLWVDDVPRGDKAVEVPANGEVEVSFTLPSLDAGAALHQGRVQFTGTPDPLAFDDVRYFTFAIRPATRVLIVSDLAIDADFIGAAIDPEGLPPGTARAFRAERIRTSQLLEHAESLSKQYRVIFVNNVERLGEDDWAKLRGFVLDGGGLVVGLGHRSRPENYTLGAAPQVLPVTPGKPVSAADGTTFGDIVDLTHPLFSRFEKDLRAMLNQVPVAKYWGVTPHENSRVLLTFSDKAPALVERTFKGPRVGRVLLWTTPLSRRPDSADPNAWNEFPVALDWSFWYLMNQSVSYLAGLTEDPLDFEAGKDVILPIDPSRRLKNYIVQGPDKKTSDRLTPTANADSLAIAAQQPGQWNVIGSGEDGKTETMGFSVNAPADESRLTALSTADLEKLFGGKDTQAYSLADDATTLRRAIQDIRVGRELFPWVMLLIMIIVTAESLLANRFYRETPAAQPALSKAAA